eukprot:5247347-Pleurochrysis_carterae.AAC.1
MEQLHPSLTRYATHNCWSVDFVNGKLAPKRSSLSVRNVAVFDPDRKMVQGDRGYSWRYILVAHIGLHCTSGVQDGKELWEAVGKAEQHAVRGRRACTRCISIGATRRRGR